MKELAIARTPAAHDPPLTIGHLLAQGVESGGTREIVYRDRTRHGYAQSAERVARLAGVLAAIGVKPGSTVAMMDWDSHRYLEAFFAVPMMGAVLHTVNVRLAPEQILWTINHAKDDVILVHADFLPVLERISTALRPGIRFVLIADGAENVKSELPFAGEYEALLAAAKAEYDFPAL